MLRFCSSLSLSGAVIVVAAAAALGTMASAVAAGPVYVPGPNGSVEIKFEGIDVGPDGIDIKLFKTGRLMTVNEAKPQAPRDRCPAGQRLVLTATTMVASDPKGELLEWYNQTAKGTIDRRSGSIIILDNDGETQRQYNFHECFLTGYQQLAGEDQDCDGVADDSDVAVTLSVGIVEVIANASESAKANPADGSWNISVDGCVSGGDCPGLDTDNVSLVSLEVDAASAFGGGAANLMDGVSKLRLQIGGADCNDGICGWMLRAQAGPAVSGAAHATISTTRSNIKNKGKAPADGRGAKGGISLTNVRILSVELPTFDLDPKSPAEPNMMVEEIEFVVEKVERG